MTLAIVKAEPYQLTADELARCLRHLTRGYNPDVTYRTLWPHSAPLTFNEFLRQYADAIVAATAPTAERWRSSLSVELRQRQRELDETARELRAALVTLAEQPLDEGPERLNQIARQVEITDMYGKAPAISAALVAITRELRAIRAGQLADAAAIVGMLAANAGARSAE